MSNSAVVDLWPPDLLICPKCGQDLSLVRHFVSACGSCAAGSGEVRCTPEIEHRPWCKVKAAL